MTHEITTGNGRNKLLVRFAIGVVIRRVVDLDFKYWKSCDGFLPRVRNTRRTNFLGLQMKRSLLAVSVLVTGLGVAAQEATTVRENLRERMPDSINISNVEQRIATVFGRIDDDGDGYITKEELDNLPSRGDFLPGDLPLRDRLRPDREPRGEKGEERQAARDARAEEREEMKTEAEERRTERRARLSEAMFSRADKDGDGKISQSEWAGNRLDTLKALDIDNDGMVTREEIQALRPQ